VHDPRVKVATLVKLAAGAAVAVVVAVVAAAAWHVHGPRHVPAGQPPLADLEDVGLDAFRAAFNDGDGEWRLLVLLSPT
jgi:hypothetical protein